MFNSHPRTEIRLRRSARCTALTVEDRDDTRDIGSVDHFVDRPKTTECTPDAS
jgi:hypothetical protein